jgi:hypothetical protein
MNNTDVQMGVGAKIIILSGATLTLDNASIVRARCGTMWDRIEIQAGGVLIVKGASTIQDGENAIVSNGGGVYRIEGAAKLNKNYKHLTINTFANTHTGFIKNTTIQCRQTATTVANDFLLPPYSGLHSAVGVEINSVKNITIGEATQFQGNVFDNMDIGIASTYSSFKVYNNEFKNIFRGTPYSCPCVNGTAICGQGIPNNNVQNMRGADIGGTLSFQLNVIHDCTNAIDLKTNLVNNVLNNTIYRINNLGIGVTDNFYAFNSITIKNNLLDDVAGSIIILTNNPTAVKTIDNNEINWGSLTITNPLSTAINVSEISSNTLSNTINGNKIKQVKNGILLNAANKFTVSNNQVFLNAAPWNGSNPAQSYGKGIGVVNASNTNVNNNDVSAANRDNWWVDGIRVSNSIGNVINCNYMYKTSSGLFFDGNCTPSSIYQNNMRRNLWGLLVNNGMIGTQFVNSGTTYASDNIWTGPYFDNNTQYYHTNCLGNSTATNSILNVRNNNGTPYLPSPFYPTSTLPNNFILPFSSTNIINNICANVDATDINPGLPFAPSSIGGAQYQVAYSQTQWEWWMKHGLYLEAKQNPDLNLDLDLLAFKQQVDAEALGKLVDIQEKLADTTLVDSASYGNIKMLNDAIIPDNEIEERYKKINDLAIRLRLAPNKEAVYTLEQIDELRTIANLCPLDFGPGVYMARAALNQVDNVPTDYINDCEMAVPSQNNSNGRTGLLQPKPASYSADEELDMQFEQNPKPHASKVVENYETKIYPNPANNVFTISNGNNTDLTYCEIYNNLGVLVAKQTLLKSNVEIAISAFANGIYTIKIYNAKGNISVQKLNVLH